MAEDGVARRYAEPTRQREVQSAAQAVAADCRDAGHWVALNPPCELLTQRREAQRLESAERGEFTDLSARSKAFPRAGDHHGARSRNLLSLIEQPMKLFEHGASEPREARGIVQF